MVYPINVHLAFVALCFFRLDKCRHKSIHESRFLSWNLQIYCRLRSWPNSKSWWRCCKMARKTPQISRYFVNTGCTDIWLWTSQLSPMSINIKTIFPSMEISIIKIKRSWDFKQEMHPAPKLSHKLGYNSQGSNNLTTIVSLIWYRQQSSYSNRFIMEKLHLM